jgi:hypothetical protein
MEKKQVFDVPLHRYPSDLWGMTKTSPQLMNLPDACQPSAVGKGEKPFKFGRRVCRRLRKYSGSIVERIGEVAIVLRDGCII